MEMRRAAATNGTGESAAFPLEMNKKIRIDTAIYTDDISKFNSVIEM